MESGIQVEALGHRDQATEQKEKALERLSSFHPPPTRQNQPAANAAQQSGKTEQAQVQIAQPQIRMPAQQSQTRSSRQDADPSSSSQREIAAATHDQLSSERVSEDAESPDDNDVLHRGGSLKMADEAVTPMTDGAPPQTHSQDGSATYLANAMEAVNILLSSASQQTAVLGLSTLLTILKVEHTLTTRYTAYCVPWPCTSCKHQLVSEREITERVLILKHNEAQCVMQR